MNLASVAQPVRSRAWLGYLLALLLSAGTLVVRARLGDLLVGFPFLLATIAVTITAFVAGRGPALLAAVLAGGIARYFFIEPKATLALAWPGDWIAVGFYALLCGIIILLIEGLFAAHAAQAAVEADLRLLNASLEQRVAERTAALEAEMAERTEAQAQLRQLQRMESIGQLTGGVAHDFNNMLAIIIGSLDLASRRLESGATHRVAGYLQNARDGAERAAMLTARLLAFSRQQPLAPHPLDPNRLVSGMSELLRRALGETVQVQTVLAGGLWPILADPGELENAILNLAVNARDAMPAGGRLTIETANADLDERYARAHLEVTPGQYVLISVSDDGIGMPPHVAERAFEPFYTTKPPGQGTGLGLSQVFGFIKQSGGHVKIYSEVGHGTTVKLYLPRHRGALAEPGDDRRREEIPSGRAEQVILVVEDETSVRHVTVDALRELGFTVVSAASAAEALEQIELLPRVDLLFTDIVMAGMDGRELADRVHALRPEVRILFTTGYTRNAVVHRGMLDPGVAFLAKPFTIEVMAHKVHDVLAGGGFNRPPE